MPRSLKPEERELWRVVSSRARPLRPQSPRSESSRSAQAEQEDPTQADPEPRNGEIVRPSAGSRRPQSDVADWSWQMPPQIDRKTQVRMRRGKLRPEARLDLHGMTLAEAHSELIRFVFSAQAGRRRMVLVITGKGRGSELGALRRQVPVWLAAAPLSAAVQQFVPAHRTHGGEGALYVWLRRP